MTYRRQYKQGIRNREKLRQKKMATEGGEAAPAVDNLQEEGVGDLTTLNENASQDTKCFINCIAQSEGLVSNGNLSMSATIAYFDRQTALMRQMGVIVDGTTFNALRQNCFTLGTNATCDAVYQQFLCVRRALQSSISYIGRRRRRQEQRPEVPGVAAIFYLASSQVTRNT
ncbi:uncharacterized protein LOC124616516 [Schistocerca americana]|uniref:uncharacterized protein LOC124616516 n=1 Tax=Schistocerca americana TaxID=7009 RepID=UPI001F4FF7A8|nr:uncharacterized protein LOC124616516 [Schistocerca americana]